MKAISSMATARLLTDLTAAAARIAGLPDVEVESVGGRDAAERVAAGEDVDLVFLAEEALMKLAVHGHVDADSVRPLVVSQVAVAVASTASVPSGAPGRSPLADAREVADLLRAATRIGYSTGPSGDALVAKIEEWGILDEIGDRLVQMAPGVPVARALAEGDADLGFQQLSELIGQPGVRILGTMPRDCAIETVFSGGVRTGSAQAEGARSVLEYFASEATASVRAQHFFEVPTGRPSDPPSSGAE